LIAPVSLQCQLWNRIGAASPHPYPYPCFGVPANGSFIVAIPTLAELGHSFARRRSLRCGHETCFCFHCGIYEMNGNNKSICGHILPIPRCRFLAHGMLMSIAGSSSMQLRFVGSSTPPHCIFVKYKDLAMSLTFPTPLYQSGVSTLRKPSIKVS